MKKHVTISRNDFLWAAKYTEDMEVYDVIDELVLCKVGKNSLEKLREKGMPILNECDTGKSLSKLRENRTSWLQLVIFKILTKITHAR